VVSIPLNVDRLRCVVLALCDLLMYICAFSTRVGIGSMYIRSTTSRAIQLPLGVLVSFSQALLSCTYDGGKVRGSPSAITYLTDVFQGDEQIDPSARAMEAAATPEICALGSDLLSRLAAWYVGAISPLPHLLTWSLHLARSVTLRHMRSDLQISYCFILSRLLRRKCTLPL
jgi:hypothetical protein